MRNPDRISIVLGVLEEYWRKNPDLRLGQIISNANRKMKRGNDVFFIEDDDLMDGIDLNEPASVVGSKVLVKDKNGKIIGVQ